MPMLGRLLFHPLIVVVIRVPGTGHQYDLSLAPPSLASHWILVLFFYSWLSRPWSYLLMLLQKWTTCHFLSLLALLVDHSSWSMYSCCVLWVLILPLSFRLLLLLLCSFEPSIAYQIGLRYCVCPWSQNSGLYSYYTLLVTCHVKHVWIMMVEDSVANACMLIQYILQLLSLQIYINSG